jgi:hypothetical protein
MPPKRSDPFDTPPRPSHPATVVQPKTAPPRPTARPPHPATVAQPKAAPSRSAARPPHPATVVQPKAISPHLADRPGHSTASQPSPEIVQRARASATMVNLNGAALAKQDELAWCYASIISVIAAYLNAGQTWQPCAIAAWAVNENVFYGGADPHLLESACNCCKGSNQRPENCTGANAVSPLGPVFAALNITYTRTAGDKLIWPTVTTEIDANRPIVVAFVRYDGKPGHAAMIIGYELVPNKAGHPGSGTTPYVIIFDPAAQNTDYSATLHNPTWSVKVKFNDIFASYPKDNGRYKLGPYYTNFVQNAPLPASPAWAVF